MDISLCDKGEGKHNSAHNLHVTSIHLLNVIAYRNRE